MHKRMCTGTGGTQGGWAIAHTHKLKQLYLLHAWFANLLFCIKLRSPSHLWRSNSGECPAMGPGQRYATQQHNCELCGAQYIVRGG